MVKSSKAGQFNMNMGWGWGEGQQAGAQLAVSTEWEEQSATYTVDGASCNVVAQPGGFDGELEWKWLKVTHVDDNLDANLLCLAATGLQPVENSYDNTISYTPATALEPGTYTLTFDVCGNEDGKILLWGDFADNAAWYGGGEFNVTTEWTTYTREYTFDVPFKIFHFELGGSYNGTELYLDNVSLVKAGTEESIIPNGTFDVASMRGWSRPSWHTFSLGVAEGPAHASVEPEVPVVPGEATVPAEATDLQASAKGHSVTLTCKLPTKDIDGHALPVLSKIYFYTYREEPVDSALNVPTSEPFTFVIEDVPSFSFGCVAGMEMYNGDYVAPMQAFPRVFVRDEDQTMGVPAASDDLTATVDVNNVTISFTLPTKDVNDNPLSIDDLTVTITRSTGGEYEYVFVAKGANIPVVDGKVVWTDTNLYNNFYRYRVTVGNKMGETAMYRGFSEIAEAVVNVKYVMPVAVDTLEGAADGEDITLTWSVPEYNPEDLTLTGYEIYCDDVLVATVDAAATTYTMAGSAKANHNFHIIVVYTYGETEYKSYKSNVYNYEVDSILGISIDAADVEYYNLQGVRVYAPASGMYIVKQGQKVAKVYVK